ncbi:MAG: Cytochrome c554 [Chlorobi bacterium OLB4]|jgi:predicted acyl esterase|nr:MAG: Cytochrome c554 [Chlorobi bacterium OLB4]MBW7856184.1 alpha/beta hydrolase [Ignavibacteria bacterium]OQY78002.1 MAG: hypothetical protein B6D43_05675 [Ignavibacteriales bacterium UTCHB1]
MDLKFWRLSPTGILCALVTLLLILSASDTFSQDKRKPIMQQRYFDNFKYRMLPSPIPQADNPTANVIQQDFTVAMSDGALIDCSRFYLDEPNIFLPDGYPIVIMVHGYGDRKETLAHFASAQAQYFYVVYTFSVRGQGNSGGQSNLISRTEAQDLIELVNHFKSEKDLTGSDTNKILIMGGSQGGTLPYMAASMGMKVSGIISALTSPQFASSWIENGSVKMTLLWSLEYPNNMVRYNPLTEAMSDWIYETGQKNDKWDSLAYWMPIDRDFENLVQYNQTPVLVENSWQDYFFNTKQGINSIPFLTFPRTFYFGAVMGHGGDTSYTENQWHMAYFNNFFNQYLWKWTYTTYPMYNYAYTTLPRNGNMWSFEHGSSDVWPPEGVTPTKLYFYSKSRLASRTVRNRDAKVVLINKINPHYSLRDAIYDDFVGEDFSKKFLVSSRDFLTTTPLTIDQKMIGTPKVKITYSSKSSLPQFNFHIIEKTSTGEEYLVNRINYTDRDYTPNTMKTVEVEGNSHAHIFKSGSKILVRITNLDRHADDRKFLGNCPHVLPSMDGGNHKLYLYQSYIELPFEQTDQIITMSEPETEEETLAELNQPVLGQNFPNPFNPATTISFTLPEQFAGHVTLKIFDQLGKEVASLQNGNLSEGSYEFVWNAVNFASGVYYYRLDAGSFTQVRRMLLIK